MSLVRDLPFRGSSVNSDGGPTETVGARRRDWGHAGRMYAHVSSCALLHNKITHCVTHCVTRMC
jgi:hypothetical protein